MAAKNEFTPEKEEKSKKKRTKKMSSDAPKKKYSGKAALNKLDEKVDLTKVRRISGIIFLVISVYTFLACLSYFSTWQVDQDNVINKGLFEFLFEDSESEVSNWLGKFGAWISHLLIYRWFGIASFSFVLIFVVTGVYLLFKIKLLPIRKVLAQSILGTIWTSIFLGFFSYKIEYLGGSFGFYINDWLNDSVGKFGAFVFIAALFFIFLYILFEPNFNKSLALLGFKKTKEVEEEIEEEQATSSSMADIHIVNDIKDEEIKEDEISQAINFGEDEKQEEEVAEETPQNNESELIIDVTDLEETKEAESEDDFKIEVAEEKDEELDDREINSKVEEFGEYDPKLDLSSYRLPPVDLLVDHGDNKISVNKEELEKKKDSIVQTLSNYKIEISKIGGHFCA